MVQKGKMKMADINEQIEKAEEEIRQIRNRKKKLLNQKKEKERKARTHRLIERGAILESLLDCPEQYDNEQIKKLLELAFRTSQVQPYLIKTKAVGGTEGNSLV